MLEDDAGVRDTLVDILEDRGYTVEAVASVAEASGPLPPFGIALVDINLPDGSGVDVARMLRETQPDVDIVFVTAAASLDTAIDALEMGAVRYLQKPCPPTTLLDVLGQIGEARELRREAALQRRRVAGVATMTQQLLTTLDFDKVATIGLGAMRQATDVDAAAFVAQRPRRSKTFVVGELAPAVLARLEDATWTRSAGALGIGGQLHRDDRLVPGAHISCASLGGVEGTLDGTLFLQHTTPELDEEMVTLLGTQLVVALQQAALHEDLRAAHEQMRATHRTLVEAEKQSAIGRLAAGVAHEIGTPLNIISGRAEVLLGRAAPDSRMATGLQTIVSQIDRIAALVRQMLDFSRAETDGRQRIPITAVLSETLPLLETRVMKRQVSITNRVSDGSCMVYGSLHQLQQVVLNLVLNAVDAGAEAIVIDCAHPAEGSLRLTFEDDGSGIDADKAETIFEPFYTTKPRGAGTGLGLAVVRGIVNDHGGRIYVEQPDIGGTRFCVELPTA